MQAESPDKSATFPTLCLHATCVAVEGRGVLLLGESGSGKSDLALRLIDSGAVLVADDQVVLHRVGDELLASPPPAIAGMLEVRGVGIMQLPWRENIALCAIFDLQNPPARLPEPTQWELAGKQYPLFRLQPFEASATAKIRMVVRHSMLFNVAISGQKAALCA